MKESIPVNDILDECEIALINCDFDRVLRCAQEFQDHDSRLLWMCQLARNIQACMDAQPMLYQQLKSHLAEGHWQRRYEPMVLRGGDFAVRGGAYGSFAVAGDPRKLAHKQINDALPEDVELSALLVAGVQNGYSLSELAQHPIKIDKYRSLPVLVVEDDIDHLICVLKIHDWSGPDSPLCCRSYNWILDSEPDRVLAAYFLKDFQAPIPNVFVGDNDLVEASRGVCQEVVRIRLKSARESFRMHATEREMCSFRAVAMALGDPDLGKHTQVDMPVLIVASKFVKDSVSKAMVIGRSLERAGWKAHMLVERDELHRITREALWHELGSVRAALLVVVDHPLLCEIDLVNDSTPLVVYQHYVQGDALSCRSLGSVHVKISRPLSLDHINNLRRSMVFPSILGESISPHITQHRDRVVRVFKDAPARPEEQLSNLLERVSHDSQLSSMLNYMGRQMIDQFMMGVAVDSVKGIELAMGRNHWDHHPLKWRVVRALMPLMHDLYQLESLDKLRQAIVEIPGAEMEIYGEGWDQYRKFAKFAMAKPQDEECRVSLIQNASMVYCASLGYALDEELIEVVRSGGLPLVRCHPINKAVGDLAKLVCSLNAQACREQDIEEAVSDDLDRRDSLEQLRREVMGFIPGAEGVDLAVLLRSCARGGLLDENYHYIAGTEDISFTSSMELRSCLDTWLDATEGLRLEMIEEQQISLGCRIGVNSAIRRVMNQLARQFLYRANQQPARVQSEKLSVMEAHQGDAVSGNKNDPRKTRKVPVSAHPYKG